MFQRLINRSLYQEMLLLQKFFDISGKVLKERKSKWKERETDFNSGTLWKYSKTVGSASSGAVTHPGAKEETHTYSDI